MRRALASLLLALFSFPLIGPMLHADDDSSLPSCCRRNGKHHCSPGGSTGLVSGDTASSPALKAIQPRCSNYPLMIAVPRGSSVAFLKNAPSIGASLVSYPSVEARTEAQYRVSFSRSRQKRGPPVLFS
jgi:hypothetical protein